MYLIVCRAAFYSVLYVYRVSGTGREPEVESLAVPLSVHYARGKTLIGVTDVAQLSSSCVALTDCSIDASSSPIRKCDGRCKAPSVNIRDDHEAAVVLREWRVFE